MITAFLATGAGRSAINVRMVNHASKAYSVPSN
jgi:hypothetical protein